MRRRVTDMTGHEVEIMFPPKRIISVVPSQTELLADLGLDEEVMGITKFCVHPERWFRSKRRVGGTKQLNMELIRQLQPDLIIANKEENTKDEIEVLQGEFPVWTSDIKDLGGALEMIRTVGALTGREQEANGIAAGISSSFEDLWQTTERRRVAYFIWYRPWMTVGSDTFIHHMLELAGFDNVMKHKTRYPEIELEELAAAAPEVVLLSSEPFPFKEKHMQEMRQAVPGAEVRLVDGELFSWYGSRLRYSAPYFRRLLSEL